MSNCEIKVRNGKPKHRFFAFKCAFCQKPLTRREISRCSIMDFRVTCVRHYHLRMVWDVKLWLMAQQKHLRKKFGINKFGSHIKHPI